MKKGQVYEGVVERIDFPNKGIVKVGEDVCVVKNALPGQKVTFSIREGGRPSPSGDRTVTVGVRKSVFPFWVVRRLYLFVFSL
mgnify:CR=1 FL=1